MKLCKTVVAIFAVLVLGGCFGPITQEKTNTIDVTQRQIRNGLVYQDNHPNPYTGEITSFYANGQKASEEYYVDGKKQGKAIGWHDNGQKKIEASYVDGKEQGKAITWDESGQTLLEVDYVDGKIMQQTDP
jgi:antitoxin component YwqK of YwqJK toxin-antitoxin module